MYPNFIEHAFESLGRTQYLIFLDGLDGHSVNQVRVAVNQQLVRACSLIVLIEKVQFLHYFAHFAFSFLLAIRFLHVDPNLPKIGTI